MQQENHMSIPLPSIYRGLEIVFEEWGLPDPVALLDRGGIEAIHRRFREAGKRFGYPERTTPPFTVSLVVAALMSAGRLEEASKVLLHDTTTYPPPWNQLDALARAYEKRGDTGQAVRYYRLSLKQNPSNEFARKKLTETGIKVPEQQED
jgi:predicted Zn-dependent protease